MSRILDDEPSLRAPVEGETIKAPDIDLLREGDILRHMSDGQFVFSGRTKLAANGSARLEVRPLGGSGWRLIPYSAFAFVSRPQGSRKDGSSLENPLPTPPAEEA